MMRTVYQEKNYSIYICLRLYKMNNVLNTKRPEWVHGTHIKSWDFTANVQYFLGTYDQVCHRLRTPLIRMAVDY
jgi:hypothetical protein